MMKSKSSSALLEKCKSVEILSDVSITDELPKPLIRTPKQVYSDSELVFQRKNPSRRTLTRTATMSGLALKADVRELMDDIQLAKALFSFERVHMVTSDGILVISSARDFMIERRVTLNGAKIREVKNRKRTALLLTEAISDKTFILKFRCRTERQKWYRVLKRQSGRPQPQKPVEFTPNKRRQIYFIDGPEELRQQTEAIQRSWDQALKPDKKSKNEKIKEKIAQISNTLLSCIICEVKE